MSSLVQTALTAKRLGLGNAPVALAASSTERRRILACAVFLSSLLLVANAHGAEVPKTTASKTPSREGPAGVDPRSDYDMFGKRYHVRASSDGYRERGIASWYGRPFDGRPTSSGEMYDMHGMTAAHPTLPIPTWVVVTNLKNGKRVTVKVNDRGPFVGKRLIDLSYAAAAKLDMVRAGTAQVEVRALPGPPPRETTADHPSKREPAATQARERNAAELAGVPSPPAPTPEPTPAIERSLPPAKESERLFAEAGKFRNRDDAIELVESLKRQGLVNAFVVTEDGRRKSLHRVRVGPLPDAAAVEEMNGRLRKLGARHRHEVAMN